MVWLSRNFASGYSWKNQRIFADHFTVVTDKRFHNGVFEERREV